MPLCACTDMVEPASKTRVGINGFGRIGRLTFRYIMEMPEFEVVLVRQLAPPKGC